MKILYDDQIFTIQHFGGISRYFCELMEQFSQDPEIDFRIALRYTLNEHLIRKTRLNRFWTRRNVFFSGSAFFETIQKKIHVNALNHVFRNRDESIRRLQEQDFDIFHPTYFDTYFLPYLGNRPCVATMYDMTLERFPGLFPREDAVRAGKKKIAVRADRIIAISESTKNDIVTVLNVPEEKIRTIHLAGSLDPEVYAGPAPSPPRTGLPDRYLLFVGNRFTYKNFTFMADALAPVFAEDPTLYLVCAGGGLFSRSENEHLQKNGMASRVLLLPADDATLGYLYRNAIAFIFPSLYEGFGLPIIDAFNCGCPAVLSNTSSLPEVGGSAARYFDPADGASLERIIREILSDEGARKELVAKGRDRAGLFSWKKTAEMTKEAYREAAETARDRPTRV